MTRQDHRASVIDPATWPEVDPAALSASDREIYERRHHAILRYLAGDTLTEIETACHIGRGQLYHLLQRCQATHADGRLVGFRGLLRYRHTQEYVRTAPIKIPARATHGGAAGAFAILLDAYPSLRDWLGRKAREHRIVHLEQQPSESSLKLRLRGLGRLHASFLNECRTLGLSANDYPFNTQQLAKRSLAATFREELLAHFGRAARASGASHLKGLPRESGTPAAAQAFDVVEFDGHRMDIRLKVVVRDPLGFEQQFEIERIWLLVIIDVCSRAVLGYHVSLNREYNRHDVVRTVINALEPHRPRAFTVPGLAYGPLDGFPSGQLSEATYATWTWFKLDSAKANLADDVRHALTDFMGCFVDVGPTYAPDDRPYIERFFGSVASRLSSRLPGYTGANPQDARRALADPKGNLRLFVSLTELEDLLEASLAAYNATPHAGLNGRTPLEAMAHSIRHPHAWLNWLPESRRRQLYLMHTPKRARVRGYLAQGQRGHVNFYGVRYTNAALASTAGLIGSELKLFYNSADLRTVHAVTLEGTDLGLLKAQGAWGEVAHDLSLRQEILRLRGRRNAASALNASFVEAFVQEKLKQARGSRRAASSLAQTLRTLSLAPTASTDAPLPVMPVEVPPPRPIRPLLIETLAGSQAVLPGRIEPQILSIGVGYAGSFEEVLQRWESPDDRSP